jgi:hypothetical protein
VLMALFRRTYGFNKKSDEIGLSQFREMTGLENKHISIVLHELEVLNVINISTGIHARRICLNKEYKKWGVNNQSLSQGLSPTKGLSLTKVENSPQLRDTPVPNLGNTKDSIKERKTNPLYNAPQAALNDGISSVDEKAKKSSSAKTFNAWASEVVANGEKAISEYKTVWEYANSISLPREFVELAWVGFKDYYSKGLGKGKKYIDWRLTFLNSVKKNYQRIWFFSEKDNQYRLTTVGIQADKESEVSA